MPKNIREIVEEKALLLRDVDGLGPGKASEELVELSSLLASINRECADKRWVLGVKKVQLLGEHKTASKAMIYAEGSEEYKGWLTAEEYRKAVLQMMQAIKYYLRNAESEFKNM